MEAVSIHLKDNQGIQRKGEAFQLGVPFAQGALAPDTPVALVDPHSSGDIPCQCSPMAHWPDGSIRWLKLQFIGDLLPEQRRILELHPGRTPQTGPSPLTYRHDSDGIAIDTGAARFHLRPNTPAWTLPGAGGPSDTQLCLTAPDGAACKTVVDSDWTITGHGDVSLSGELQGWFVAGDVRLARFRCQLTFYRQSKTVEVRTCIHNPKRARHPGGLWDLGDPGSVHFRALVIRTAIPEIGRISVVPEPGHAPVEPEHGSCLLYQDSSGGDNWDSLNHVNASGEVSTRFRGYRLDVNNRACTAGNRAMPAITVANPELTVQASLPRFWQNFPSSMGVQDNQLVIGLFPEEAAEPYELQGGERKTQTAYFHYGNEPDALAWTLSPVVPTLDAGQYETSQAFHWFSASGTRGPLDDLIRLGLDGPSSFFAKREAIDEYGWRNFGDIFADHETLYQAPDEPPLISHYNNQYDAIYGFARQFALSGDERWYELMDDLADHVRDIDIYHTDEDRSEYNHGLFWHTDHYLPAHTATHRTFSRHNDTSSTPGQTGGGPAEEHCYSTGLLYHYFLTGSTDSRNAVLELAGWIVRLHEGSGALIEALFRIKRYDLPKLKLLLKGRPVPPHKYSFNRGTGNYINTLLDAHILEPAGSWLQQAETVIGDTIHPDDDLGSRDLLSIEKRWSYLVLLSSLSRYLVMKEEAGTLDERYRYTLASFRHYARWMARHERPFLADPDQLEFPNCTWVAQDIRKSMLLFQAARFDPEHKDEYLEKADQLLAYVTETLTDSEERNFARVLIILMQNYGPHSLNGSSSMAGSRSPEADHTYASTLTVPQLLARAGTRLLRAIRKFNLGREKAWLQTRLNH